MSKIPNQPLKHNNNFSSCVEISAVQQYSSSVERCHREGARWLNALAADCSHQCQVLMFTLPAFIMLWQHRVNSPEHRHIRATANLIHDIWCEAGVSSSCTCTHKGVHLGSTVCVPQIKHTKMCSGKQKRLIKCAKKQIYFNFLP